MTLTLMLIVGGSLLLLLMVASQLGLGGPGAHEERSDDAQAPTFDKRVEGLIGLLNYGDDKTAAVAMRQMLSMGPGILPVLLHHLARIEARPGTISPRSQLLLEEILTGFGLQTYLQASEFVRAVPRASPIYPAIMRILEGIGPNLAVELIRGPLPDPVGWVSPLFARFGADLEVPLGELLTAKPSSVPVNLMTALMPALVTSPELLRGLYSVSDLAGRNALIASLGPWPAPGVAAILDLALDDPADEVRATALREVAIRSLVGGIETAGNVETRIADELAADSPLPEVVALLDVLYAMRAAGDAPDPVGPLGAVAPTIDALRTRASSNRPSLIVDLGQYPDDPRAVERLRQLAADPGEAHGALALLTLVPCTTDPLDDVLAVRMRLAEMSSAEILTLRICVARYPERFVATAARLLKVESPRVASLAALCLAPAEVPVDPVLRALARHRYSPIEAQIAPLLWARWGQVAEAVTECVFGEDREIQQAALDMVLGLGDERAARELLDRLPTDSDFFETMLNVIELAGPQLAAPMADFISHNPHLEARYALNRRYRILLALGERRLAVP